MSNEYEFTPEEKAFMKRMGKEYHHEDWNVDFDHLSLDELELWMNLMCTVEMERAGMDDKQWDFDADMAARLYNKTIRMAKSRWETEDDED